MVTRAAVRRKSKAELDPDRIAAAALRVLDAGGLESFTMRAVADVLGVTPMALYHHVADKAALAALVVDAVNRETPLPIPSGAWRDDLFAIAAWTRRMTLAHPAAGKLRRTFNIWTPSILQVTERWQSLWQQSGLSHEACLRAANMSSGAIIGMVDQELMLRDMQKPDAALLKMLPNARLALGAKRDRAAEFEMVVRSVIDGLYTRLS